MVSEGKRQSSSLRWPRKTTRITVSSKEKKDTSGTLTPGTDAGRSEQFQGICTTDQPGNQPTVSRKKI